jgi:hypothetical protein
MPVRNREFTRGYWRDDIAPGFRDDEEEDEVTGFLHQLQTDRDRIVRDEDEISEFMDQLSTDRELSDEYEEPSPFYFVLDEDGVEAPYDQLVELDNELDVMLRQMGTENAYSSEYED